MSWIVFTIFMLSGPAIVGYGLIKRQREVSFFGVLFFAFFSLTVGVDVMRQCYYLKYADASRVQRIVLAGQEIDDPAVIASIVKGFGTYEPIMEDGFKASHTPMFKTEMLVVYKDGPELTYLLEFSEEDSTVLIEPLNLETGLEEPGTTEAIVPSLMDALKKAGVKLPYPRTKVNKLPKTGIAYYPETVIKGDKKTSVWVQLPEKGLLTARATTRDEKSIKLKAYHSIGSFQEFQKDFALVSKSPALAELVGALKEDR